MERPAHGRGPGRFGRRPWEHGSQANRAGPPRGRNAPRPQPPRPQAKRTDWDHVASWYDKLVGEEGSDYHRHVILPAALRLLDPRPGEKLLDLCCGQGVFCRLAAEKVGQVVGVDASGELIDAARRYGTGQNIRYVVADARNLGPLADGSFDLAACLMAVQDLDDIAAVFAGLAAALKSGGRAVIIMMHPCFRIPRQSSWGWDQEKKVQFRRIDRYASAMEIPIYTHPGSGGGQQTVFYHRPLADYIAALGSAGVAVIGCEELSSHRTSQPGGHSRGENRAREEVPIFLALKVVKTALP